MPAYDVWKYIFRRRWIWKHKFVWRPPDTVVYSPRAAPPRRVVAAKWLRGGGGRGRWWITPAAAAVVLSHHSGGTCVRFRVIRATVTTHAHTIHLRINHHRTLFGLRSPSPSELLQSRNSCTSMTTQIINYAPNIAQGKYKCIIHRNSEG